MTISEQQADEISLLSVQNLSNKAISHHLKQIQHSLQVRNKKTQVYIWTVAALQRQYQRRLCEDRMLSDKHEKEWSQQKQSTQQLEQDITNYTQQVETHEEQLQTARSHAQQRQTKYHIRQRQFHRYSKIPMINTTYKKKYLRAQNKNHQAESDVAAQRHEIDHIKVQRTILLRQLQHQQQEQHQLELLVTDLRAKMTTYEALMAHWNEGRTFWTDRMAHISQIINDTISRLHHSPRPDPQQLHEFRQICMEYEEMERYGDEHYHLNKVDFDCAKCMQQVSQDLPRPDKNRPTDILCTTCYQAARTSMIIRKKLGFLQSPSSSSSSITSSRQGSFSSSSPTPPPKDPPLNHVI